MKLYLVTVDLNGSVMVEDPHCPSYWRGSGVYDIDAPAHQEVEVTVCAADEEEAKKIALAYDYDNSMCELQDLKDVTVLDMDFLAEDEEGTKAEVVETAYGALEEIECYEPDPDDIYNERMERDF